MSGKRPTILVFVRYYLPGYKSGGPIRTIANMVDALGDEFDFKIVTSDRDATDGQPYDGVAVDAWSRVGKASVYYASPRGRKFANLVRLVRATPHDAVYHNSFFDPGFTILPLVCRRFGLLPARPCLLAPRGEFAESALAIRSAKKALFLRAAKLIGLHGSLLWQASSPREEQDIVRMFPKARSRIRVAPNLPERQPEAADPARGQGEAPGPLRICFLSRVTPMKNLDFALDVLARLDVAVSFDIFGPVRDEDYWNQCRQLMTALPAHVTARYRGEVEHSAVPEVLSPYDLFFLPTRGENYGHVILEALAAGLPILIADTTPWRDLDKTGAGWDLSLADPAAFAATITRFSRMDAAQRLRMRKAARALADSHIADSATVETSRGLLREITGAAA